MASRFALSLFLLGAVVTAETAMVQPRYREGNQLIRPEEYREWVFVGSNLGMGYSEGQPAREPTFHNIYMQPQAYRHYKATGKFLDKTMLVMEVVSSASQSSINRRGQFQDKIKGVEVALKDEGKFPEKWAYFDFIGSDGAPLSQAKPFAKDACWKCHNEHGAVDNVFVQFYPVLRDRM
jgi:hypothetical protein